MKKIKVHTFSAMWKGLPAAGPFDIKLLAWMNLAGIPYEQVFEDDTRKGPKRKNPWIELDGERIGDTEIIIEHLVQRFGVDLDAGLSPHERALGLAWRRTFEEHFHQVLEWELLVHPAGAAFMKAGAKASLPPVIGTLLFRMMQRGIVRQLYARGLGRHSPDIIERKGRADIDALSDFLAERPYLVVDRAVTADTAVFGLIAPMIYWPMQTPVAEYARKVDNVRLYCDRMRALCFHQSTSAANAR